MWNYCRFQQIFSFSCAEQVGALNLLEFLNQSHSQQVEIICMTFGCEILIELNEFSTKK